jgi:hypothetical protein
VETQQAWWTMSPFGKLPLAKALRSPPAQKTGPSPARITALTRGSFSISSTASTSHSATALLSALRASGRVSVTRAIRSLSS